MRRTQKYAVVAVVSGLVLLAAVAYSVVTSKSGESVADESARPKVAATIFPLYDIVRSVAGDALTVNLILPPNAEPHTYEPSPQTVRSATEAEVIFAIGHGLDNWIMPIAQANGVSLKVVDDGIGLLPSERHGHDDEGEGGDHEAGLDPHYWLSSENAKAIARTVAHDLSERVPASASVFSRNLAAFETLMDATDTQVRTALAPITNRSLATFHGAFRYFAAAYGLKIVAEFEPYPGREPSPKYLTDLKRGVEAAGVRVIYGEPAFSTATISSFADDNGLTLGKLDPLGGDSGRESLASLLVWNAQSIADTQR